MSHKRVSKKARKTLFDSGFSNNNNELNEDETQRKKSYPWSVEETRALVAYICLFWENSNTNKWPTMRDATFWKSCATAIAETTKCAQRTGKNH